MQISGVFYKKTVVASADQHPSAPYGTDAKDDAEENINGGGEDSAVLDQQKSFVGEGGKGGETAAETDLQK